MEPDPLLIRDINGPKDLADVIAYLVTLGGLPGVRRMFGDAFADDLGARIRDALKRHRYGFTYSDEDAQRLYNISQSDAFKRLKVCLGGKHWSLHLLRVGLRICELHEARRHREVDEIREDVYAKHGRLGLRIIELSTTGAIRDVLEYISDLKFRKNYETDVLVRIFERVLDEWDDITIFVTGERRPTATRDIKARCREMMRLKRSLFFIFASGEPAIKVAQSAVAELSNEGRFHHAGYVVWLRPGSLGALRAYSWTIEHAESYLERL